MAENKRYISRIRLENFQDHKNTDIELESGINLIIGSSDAGKSAVLRAINWVFHNEPRGSGFVRRGSDEARVTIWFNDGTMVTRIKGKQRNAIAIHKADGQQLAFEKIGNDIPPEAIEALGKPPIDDRHGPISYAEQMGPLFLTSLSPTDLPRSLSELTGIDDFEAAAQLLGKRSRKSGEDAKDSQTRIDGYATQLLQYENLDEQLETLSVFENKTKEINDAISKIDNINNLLSKYELIRNTGKQTNNKLKRSKAISQYSDDLDKIQDIKKQIIDVETLITSHRESISKENDLTNIIKRLNKISAKEFQDKANKISVMLSNIKEISDLLKQYDEIMQKGTLVKSKLSEWTNIYDNLIIEKSSVINEMKIKGLWCIKCNRPLAIDTCDKGDLNG